MPPATPAAVVAAPDAAPADAPTPVELVKLQSHARSVSGSVCGRRARVFSGGGRMVAGRTSVDVQVEYNGARSDVMTVPVLASRPGIFSLDGSGQGQGAILNEDGSL